MQVAKRACTHVHVYAFMRVHDTCAYLCLFMYESVCVQM